MGFLFQHFHDRCCTAFSYSRRRCRLWCRKKTLSRESLPHLCILATAFLFFVQSGMIVAGMVLLILANIGFEAGLVFYDAFLPEISTERSYGRVSGYGYALGYAGSLFTLAVAYPLYADGFSETNLFNVRFSFLIAAGCFLVFSLPLFFLLAG